MKIVLSGVETNNKGAELMLYAILQEIERKFPKAKVYVAPSAIQQGLSYVKTTVELRYWPLGKFLEMTHLNSILSRLHLPEIKDARAVMADYLFDGSGFLFSDQCKLWGIKPEWWDKLLKRQYNHRARIVFLPQAFGPLEMEDTKKAVFSLGKYASSIMAREQISYNYLEQSGLVDMGKVKLFPDFTSLVEGVFPDEHKRLRDGICVIPNMKMIEKGKITYDDYLHLLSAIIVEGKKSGRPVYLLNHEGKKDEKLALRCQEKFKGEIDVVTGLDALAVKGLISSAYIVITSRFHGLASSLNSCVPSLATSWSHKYSELFRDYGLNGYVLPLDNLDVAIEQVRRLLTNDENSRLRHHLVLKKTEIQEKTRAMWNYIWELK